MRANFSLARRFVGLVSLALAADVACAWAQADGVVTGQVLAAADGSPLAQATVSLLAVKPGETRRSTTDAEGRFVFPAVTAGEYLLSASSAGFAPRDVRFDLAPREVRSLVVRLELGVAVSVDVTGDHRAAGTHSPSSTLLTTDRLDEMPLAQRTNLPDAIISAAPGMIRGHDDFVHIRGHEVALNPSINGVQFWENAHAVFSPGLGVDYIESINVMTGGFSAEYGNRFGGILDVVTKSGLSMRNQGSVTWGSGTAQRHNVGVEFGTRAGALAYYLNAGGFTSDRFLSPPSPRSIHNTGRGARTFGRVDLQGGDRNHVNLVVTGDGINFEIPIEERDERLRPNFKHLQRARSQSAILSWNHVPSSRMVMQTAAYQRWSRVRQLPEAIDRYGAQTDAERTLHTVGVKSDITRVAGRHTLKGGVDVVLLRADEAVRYLSQPWIDFTHVPEVNEGHVHFRGPNLGPGIPRPVIFDDNETGGQASLFVQDKVQLTPSLTVDVGVRFDRYRLVIAESHLSPRVNAAYRFSSGSVLFASYNHFFVPPPVENILAGSAGLTQLISEIGRPLPPVRPIKEDQFEVGVTHPIAGLATVGITGYYRASEDPPHTSLFPDSRFYTYATFDRGQAYGMELKANMPKIGNLGLSGYLNYALGRVWFYNPIRAGFSIEAAHLNAVSRFLAPMDQTHTATAGLSYHHARTKLWAALAAEYGSGTPGGHGDGDDAHADGEPHEHASGPGLCGTRCPSRVTPNLSVGWNARASRGHQPRFALQLNVENVSNRVYLLSKESSMVQGQYSTPRMLSVSVKVRF